MANGRIAGISGINFAKQRFKIDLNICIDKDLNNHLKELSLRTNRSVSSIVRKTLYKIFLNKDVQ